MNPEHRKYLPYEMNPLGKRHIEREVQGAEAGLMTRFKRAKLAFQGLQAVAGVVGAGALHAGGKKVLKKFRVPSVLRKKPKYGHKEMPRTYGKASKMFSKRKYSNKRKYHSRKLNAYAGVRKAVATGSLQMLSGAGLKTYYVPVVPFSVDNLIVLAGTQTDAPGQGPGLSDYLVTGTTIAPGTNDIWMTYGGSVHYTLRNTSNFACELTIYKCTARKEININDISNMAATQMPHVAPLYEGWKQVFPTAFDNYTGVEQFGPLPSTSATAYANGQAVFAMPSFTPFESPLFASLFNVSIVKHQNFRSGDQKHLVIPLETRKWKADRDYKGSTATTGKYLNKGTSFYMFGLLGQAVYDTTVTQIFDPDPGATGGTGMNITQAGVTTGDAQISLLYDYRMNIRAWAPADNAEIITTASSTSFLAQGQWANNYGAAIPQHDEEKQEA